jgi:hypothetical protein
MMYPGCRSFLVLFLNRLLGLIAGGGLNGWLLIGA